MLKSSKSIVISGIIAGLYVVLSLLVFPFSGGAIQLRISEALCILPLLFPESILALTVGCFLSNVLTGCAMLDTVFGSLITLISAVFTCIIGKTACKFSLKVFIGGLFPVILNALLLPVIWAFCYGLKYIYPLQALFLLISQSVAVYGLGIPITVFFRKKLKNKAVE